MPGCRLILRPKNFQQLLAKILHRVQLCHISVQLSLLSQVQVLQGLLLSIDLSLPLNHLVYNLTDFGVFRQVVNLGVWLDVIVARLGVHFGEQICDFDVKPFALLVQVLHLVCQNLHAIICNLTCSNL